MALNVLIKKNGVAVVESVNENEKDKIKKIMKKNIIPGTSIPKIIVTKISYKYSYNNEQLLEEWKRQNECMYIK